MNTRNFDQQLCQTVVATPRWTTKIHITENGCHHWLASDQFAVILKDPNTGTPLSTCQPHRVAWIAAHGNPPADTGFIRHCADTKCVNPDHMSVTSSNEAGKHKFWDAKRYSR